MIIDLVQVNNSFYLDFKNYSNCIFLAKKYTSKVKKKFQLGFSSKYVENIVLHGL